MPKVATIEELDFGTLVRAGERVSWGQAGGEPLTLTGALMAQRARIGRFDVVLGISLSETPDPAFADHVRFSAYCGTAGNRRLAQAGLLDIQAVNYSRIADAIAPIDVLLLHLPPPRDGHYSFGIAQEYLVPLVDRARLVIAEINDRVPWTYGERTLTEADIDIVVETSRPPATLAAARIGPAEEAIARTIAGLVEDGSTLQLGIGALPEALLRGLRGHRDLGIHSGVIGDGVADLMDAGIITNARKSVDAGVTVAGLLLGSERLYRFAHLNPSVRLRQTANVHGAAPLARHDRFVALNAAIEVDLTGQINAEVAAGLYVGAVGGAGDFLRAAHLSKGGLPIVGLPSTGGRNAASRIVANLSGPVSTSRADAGIIVTEHGMADLRGRTLRERRRLLIDIAAPEARAALEAAPID